MPAAASAEPGNELLLFLADLGAALSAIGETVDAIELRLALIARAYGLEDARFSVFPTSLFLTLGRGEVGEEEQELVSGCRPHRTRVFGHLDG